MLDWVKTHQNPKQLSPLTLAFVGDAAFELLVREWLVEMHGSMPVGKLHKAAVQYVSASAQSAVIRSLLGILTDEEKEMYRRGRNATGNHVPKNASPREYRMATGLETLFGFLYLQNNVLRMEELFGFILAQSKRRGGE